MAREHASRFVRYGLPALALTVAFFLGYVFGYEGFGGPDDRIAVVRAIAQDDTSTPVAKPVPASAEPQPQPVSSPLSPRTDPLILPRRKSYDLSAYKGEVVYYAPRNTKRIALTFDDGPSANTAEIVEILRDHDAVATFFFCGGRMVGHEKDVLGVVRQGSEVANHTWSHVSLVGMSPESVETQIAMTQEEILRTTGVENVFIRPRAGKFDDVALDVVRKMGLVMVGWDAYGRDTFNDGKTVAEIESAAVDQTQDGSIILLHETNPSTVRALPAILDRLDEAGYEMVTLSDLLSSTL